MGIDIIKLENGIQKQMLTLGFLNNPVLGKSIVIRAGTVPNLFYLVQIHWGSLWLNLNTGMPHFGLNSSSQMKIFVSATIKLKLKLNSPV